VSQLQARRQALSSRVSGPFAKLDMTLRFTELMSDEMFALLQNLNDTERVLAQGVRPLPTQRVVTASPPPSTAAVHQDQRERQGRRRSEAQRSKPGAPPR
jgi:hypothetical protein